MLRREPIRLIRIGLAVRQNHLVDEIGDVPVVASTRLTRAGRFVLAQWLELLFLSDEAVLYDVVSRQERGKLLLVGAVYLNRGCLFAYQRSRLLLTIQGPSGTSVSSTPSARRNAAGSSCPGRPFEAVRLSSVLVTVFTLYPRMQPVREVGEAVWVGISISAHTEASQTSLPLLLVLRLCK